MKKEQDFRSILAEFLGTAALLASIIGSGIMATNLTSDIGLQLTINMISTLLVLGIAIYIFAPISGAHLNPLVTLTKLFYKRISARSASLYLLAQFTGAVSGTIIANLMFKKPALFHSDHVRSGSNIFLSEVIATAGLLFLVQILGSQERGSAVPLIIPAWVGAGFFFTSSFIFANPAVTFARGWSDTFAGISPASIPAFILAEVIGAVVGVLGARVLIKREV